MSGHLDSLNPAQRAAATAPAPVLVLAGAGSGKTETLTRRVAGLILAGGAPERLLCITFTAKAAGEMRARLAAALGPERTPRWVGTFHAVMARLLMEDGGGVPRLPRGFTILGRAGAQRLLAQVARVADAKEADALAEAVSLYKNSLAEKPRDLPRASARSRFAAELLARAAAVLPAYQAALDERQVLDFDDLIARPVGAMRADPTLAARWSARWDEILVDEYQDTNHAQHALLGLARLRARSPFRRRGRSAGHLWLARRRRDPHPAVPPGPSRRAATPQARDELSLDRRHPARRQCRRGPRSGSPAQNLAPRRPEGAGRQHRLASRGGIARGRGTARRGLGSGVAQAPQGSTLARVRGAGAVRLRRQAYPCRAARGRDPGAARARAGAGAAARPASKHRLASAGDEPPDGRAGAAETWDRAADDAFRRACAYPTGGVGGALFQRLRDHATERGVALAAAVATLPAEERERAALNGVLGCARQIGTRIEAAGLGPDAALRLAATASGSAEPPAAQAMDRRSLAWASAFVAAEQAGSVAAYCDAAALDEAMAEGAVPEAVQVMTLHRAKGLEFDHVLLAGLEEGVWPHWQADAHGTEAEERRLFYVGLTRARKSVRLTWVRKRRDWPAKPSRFLAEIPDALLDHGAAPRHPPAPTHARTAAPRPIEPPSKAETERLVAEWRARKGVR